MVILFFPLNLWPKTVHGGTYIGSFAGQALSLLAA